MDASVTHKVLAGIGWVGFAAVTSALATLGAMLLGLGIVFVILLPFSLMMLMPPFLWHALWAAFLLAAPTTFVILPVCAVLMRRRVTTSLYALPILGLVSGAVTVWSMGRWFREAPSGSVSLEILLIAGALAGLSAGALFGRALLEVRR